ncbi:MAG: aspartate--tRNA ligase [Candidatus Paceibacterota bacterium]|jgi:aspartyl-tRNA synthetase
MTRIYIKDTPNHIGKDIILCGWVRTRRDHGKIIFIDLWDATGIIQCVLAPDQEEGYKVGQGLRGEWVVKFEGEVKKRPDKMVNDKIATGGVEFLVKKVEVFSEAGELPLDIKGDGTDIKEDFRLKYRYLDLRRERMQEIMRIRSRAKTWVMNYLSEKGFTEIETPLMTKSTPEGARDFIIPSRLQAGKFYALPQSPQQYKQLLMVAGMEKYFQFARVFRDEDLRADRLFEHTQLDIEMSFASQEDILGIIEPMIIEMSEKVFGKTIQEKPFPRITYQDAMEKYGNDKPDMRKDKNNPDVLAFCWVIDFPMFEVLEDGSIDAVHHPFTAMKDEDLAIFDKINPEKITEADRKNLMKIRAKQYDLALNGMEVMGGSVRTHDAKILKKVFQMLGHSAENVEKQFGHLLEAFSYGVPPHGGIAAGFDRMLQAILGQKSIRETVAFPTSTSGITSVMDAPSEVDEKQLKELGIKVVKK